jgi:hypothetical protein
MGSHPLRTAFLRYYLWYFARPARTVRSLLQDGRRVRFAAFAVLIPATGYTVMYVCAWLAGGSPSTFKPWLAIPIAQYFKYDIFIVAPSMFLCWVLASGVIQLVSRLFSGTGSFEDTAVALGFGIGTATWATLAHDLTDAALGLLGIIDMNAYEAALNGPTFWRGLLWTLYSIYFLWFVVLFAKGLRAVHGLNWPRSILLAVMALVVYQGVFLVFNR